PGPALVIWPVEGSTVAGIRNGSNPFSSAGGVPPSGTKAARSVRTRGSGVGRSDESDNETLLVFVSRLSLPRDFAPTEFSYRPPPCAPLLPQATKCRHAPPTTPPD